MAIILQSYGFVNTTAVLFFAKKPPGEEAGRQRCFLFLHQTDAVVIRLGGDEGLVLLEDVVHEGGDLVFLMKQEKEAKTVYLVDAGDYDLESPYRIIVDFNKWMEKGFEIEDIDGEDVRGVDYGDLYLIKMPKEGVKGLVTIKRAFNLEMSTGELLQKTKSLPTKLLSNITSSKANIIAEKIGMPGLFEIR